MSGNTFGKLFSLTSFGESHGEFVGGVVDGMPSGVEIDYPLIEKKILARKTANRHTDSQRKESDEVRFISGISNGKTTGTPIAFIIPNSDCKPEDYLVNKDILKPSHAHYTYLKKYGYFNPYGSGRASARETIVRVVGGCLAMMYLKKQGVQITAYTSQIGNVSLKKTDKIDLRKIETNYLHCPDEDCFNLMDKELNSVYQENDTLGGKVSCLIENVSAGLGEPIFDKLQADLAKAMLSINASKGFEYGEGFNSAFMRGSEHNDLFTTDFKTKTNHAGGILGGISNGENIYFSVAFKPISSIKKDQESITIKGEKAIYKASGRHDICVIPRVIPVVEAMTALVLIDHILRFKSYC